MEIPEDLFIACKQGNRKGQEDLYRLCYPLLMRMLFRYVSDQSTAAAILNQSMLKVLTKLHQFEGDHNNCFAWIKRIAINDAIDWLRSNKKLNLTLPVESAAAHYTAPSANAFDAKERMQFLMSRLPAMSATVFNLHVMEGYPHVEIAEKLGISVANSKWHVHAARNKLKELLTQEESL